MLYAKARKKEFSAVETIAGILGDEAVMEVSEQGLCFYGVNKSNTMLGNLTIKKEGFIGYKVNPTPFTATIDIGEFADVLRRISADTFDMQIGERGMMVNAVGQDRTQEFIIPFLNDTTKPKDVNINALKSVELKAVNLLNTIKDIDLMAESSRLEINEKDEVVVYCRAVNGKRVKVNLVPNKQGLQKFITDNVSVGCSYANEFLEQGLKGSRVSENVKILLGNNIPLKMIFHNPTAELSVIISPRIEDNTENETERKAEVKAETTTPQVVA